VGVAKRLREAPSVDGRPTGACARHERRDCTTPTASSCRHKAATRTPTLSRASLGGWRPGRVPSASRAEK